jgi:hypothetical protein
MPAGVPRGSREAPCSRTISGAALPAVLADLVGVTVIAAARAGQAAVPGRQVRVGGLGVADAFGLSTVSSPEAIPSASHALAAAGDPATAGGLALRARRAPLRGIRRCPRLITS